MPEITHDSSHVEQHSPNSLRARKRAEAAKREKVMHEFGQGALKSSSGQKVTKRSQAVAIAISESKRHPYKK